MNTILPHSALREWRSHFSQVKTWLIMVGIAGVLTIIAPFDTHEDATGLGLFAYWLLIVALTYGYGFFIAQLWVKPGDHIATLKTAGVTALGTTLIVVVLNWAVIGYWPPSGLLGRYVGTIFALSALITAIIHGVIPSFTHREDAPETEAPRLLDRLPLEKRGALVAVSVEDHYVRIRTTQGEELILLRLSDAMTETAPTKGMQVHRSHWVALDQITAARREGDRAILTMSDDAEIPASRRYVPALKEVGILPR